MLPGTRVFSEVESGREREYYTLNYIIHVVSVARSLEQRASHNCSLQLGQSCGIAVCCASLVSCGLVVSYIDSILQFRLEWHTQLSAGLLRSALYFPSCI